MAKRRLSRSQLESLRQQARESRQQYWDEHAEGLEQRGRRMLPIIIVPQSKNF